MRGEYSDVVAGLLVAVGVGLAPAAQAGLGEGVDSVARDHATLRAKAANVVPMQSYDVHDMATSGGRVREYVTRAGTVFAVAFSGPSMPNLRALLGSHYGEYAAAVSARRTNHKVLAVREPGLVMTVIKLPRGFTGTAHVPALLPAGVAVRDLR